MRNRRRLYILSVIGLAGILMFFWAWRKPVAVAPPTRGAVTNKAIEEGGMSEGKSSQAATKPEAVPISPQESEKLKITAAFVDRIYAPMFPALGLSPAQIETLRNQIIEWEATMEDTYSIISQNPGNGVLAENVIPKMKKQIEDEIAASMDKEHFTTVKAMLDAGADFGRIANNTAPLLAKQGYPLSPEQRLSLGIVLHQTFSPAVNPLAKSRSALPIGPSTGLNELDKAALARLASVLTPPQLSDIRNSLINTNSGIRARINKQHGNK